MGAGKLGSEGGEEDDGNDFSGLLVMFSRLSVSHPIASMISYRY
jgi:hypothetical protein